MAKSKKGKKCDWLFMLTLILVIVGGLNWLLVGLFKFDLVQWLLGNIPVLRDIVYVLVGVSALYQLILLFLKK
ncbi:MAG: DUF378 domain-containing protein [Candidatus Woesearchaeota archaeon]